MKGNQTKRTESYNKDFVQFALKLIYISLANILSPKNSSKLSLKLEELT